MINDIDKVKRVIPAPPRRGKIAYMLAMEAGDAFYDDPGTKLKYWRFRGYIKSAKNSKLKYSIGDTYVMINGTVIKKTIVWRTE